MFTRLYAMAPSGPSERSAEINRSAVGRERPGEAARPRECRRSGLDCSFGRRCNNVSRSVKPATARNRRRTEEACSGRSQSGRDTRGRQLLLPLRLELIASTYSTENSADVGCALTSKRQEDHIGFDCRSAKKSSS